MRNLLISGLFSLIGLGLIFGGLYTFARTRSYINSSVVTTGKVVDLELQKSTKNSKESSVYYPLVEFITQTGQQVTFKDNVGSNPPVYRLEQEVQILYDPQNPFSARINTFTSLWLMPLVLEIGGIILFCAGALGLYFKYRFNSNVDWLQKRGTRIQAKIIGIDNIGYNQKNAEITSIYVIKSQWQDPASNKVYIFTSSEIPFNPQEFIKQPILDVLIDPKNPSKYLVDLSFLPTPQVS